MLVVFGQLVPGTLLKAVGQTMLILQIQLALHSGVVGEAMELIVADGTLMVQSLRATNI